MKKIFRLLLFAIHISCSNESPSDEQIQLGELRYEFATFVKNKYDLDMSGSGGSMMDQITIIDYRFRASKLLTIDEARQLIVSVAEEMLKQINEKEKLRPFLDHYPFTVKDINISIMFANITAREPSDLYPATVYLTNGVTRFSKDNDNHSMLVDIQQEDFEESKRIVQSQKNPG